MMKCVPLTGLWPGSQMCKQRVADMPGKMTGLSVRQSISAGVMPHTVSSSMPAAEVENLWFQGQLDLHSETLSFFFFKVFILELMKGVNKLVFIIPSVLNSYYKMVMS